MIKKTRFLTKVVDRLRLVNHPRNENLAGINPPTAEALLLGKTVIVEVAGGLCNQLMCYKTGRMVSEWNHAGLMLYVPNIHLDDHCSFFLDRYPIKYTMIFESRSLLAKILDANDVLQVKKEHLFDPCGNRYEGDRKRSLLSRIQRAKIVYMDFWLPLYLWRADQEFAPQKHILRELELNTDTYLNDRDREVMMQIKRCKNPVAVHIRRGDFLSPEYDLEVRPEYYNRALDFLSQSVSEPEFFVFSDDPDWCKRELESQEKLHFVDHNDARACTSDMYLGSLCHHFILTNHSTFSHHMVELNDAKPDRLVVTNSKDFLITQRSISEYYTPEHCTVIQSNQLC